MNPEPEQTIAAELAEILDIIRESRITADFVDLLVDQFPFLDQEAIS